MGVNFNVKLCISCCTILQNLSNMQRKKFKVCIAIIFEIQNELNSNLIRMNKRLCFSHVLKQLLYLQILSLIILTESKFGTWAAAREDIGNLSCHKEAKKIVAVNVKILTFLCHEQYNS